MMNQHPFDPVPRLAALLHAKLCPGHATDMAATECIVVIAALDDYLAELRAAGLALVPLDAIRFLQQLFVDATSPQPLEEVAPEESGDAESRARAQTWVCMRFSDGHSARAGPYPRWMAEVVLGDLSQTHEVDLVAARLEAEPAWVESLLRDLGGMAA